MKRLHPIVAVLHLLVLSGCTPLFSAHMDPYNRALAPEQVSKLVDEPAQVFKIAEQTYGSRTPPEAVEIFYREFGFGDRPASLKNWEHHYVIRPGSSPVWPYIELAEVIAFFSHPEGDLVAQDEMALRKLREIASSNGGDAVISVYRKPVTTQGWRYYSDSSVPVVAHIYNGIVVRRKDATGKDGP